MDSTVSYCPSKLMTLPVGGTTLYLTLNTSPLSAKPSIVALTSQCSASSSTLTCTSTGSPATTVSWTRNGQPVTIDGNTYQLTQTVTNRTSATYENVLTINQPWASILGSTFNCTVTNTLGSGSDSIQVAGAAGIFFTRSTNF